MRFRPLALPLLASLWLMGVMGRDASAGGGAATDAYEEIRRGVPVDLHALADLYLQNDLDSPSAASGATAQLRAFDARLDTPGLGILRVTAAHHPGPFGFRVDLAVGDLPDAYLRFDPAASAYPDASRAFSYFEQAFVSASVPLGKRSGPARAEAREEGERSLRVDAGKFETPVGLEDNESLENWNYSRSLLYLLAEPSYHTGLRATVRASESLAVSAYWVNGWDANVLAGNGMRAFAAAVTWKPSPRVEAVADYMGGLERAPTKLADPALNYRNVLDGYVTYQVSGRVALASTADYGRDAASGGVTWWGVGGYVRCTMADWLAAAVRGEHFEDPSAFTTGTRQRLAEITATLEGRDRLGPLAIVGRLEYRRDQSDERVFGTAGQALGTRQDTLSMSVVTAF